MKKTLQIALLFMAVITVAAAATASPLTLDCRTGCSVTNFGGAFWTTASIQPSGTGVFKPFVRLQATGQDTDEDGNNTDGALLNDEKGGTWTHAVKVSDLDNLITVNGQSYYEFMLDIGEPANDNKSKLSIDELKICTASSGTLNVLNNCPTAATYSLDAGSDRSVLLDYNLFGGGNGNSDLFVYIPKSALAGASTYFYMYSAMGYQTGYHADGSFEEWAFQHHDPSDCPSCTVNLTSVVPEPASLLLLGTGLLTATRRLRQVKR